MTSAHTVPESIRESSQRKRPRLNLLAAKHQASELPLGGLKINVMLGWQY